MCKTFLAQGFNAFFFFTVALVPETFNDDDGDDESYRGVGLGIEVEDADDGEVALRGVVELPGPVDDGLDDISHVAMDALER